MWVQRRQANSGLVPGSGWPGTNAQIASPPLRLPAEVGSVQEGTPDHLIQRPVISVTPKRRRKKKKKKKALQGLMKGTEK
jgi:hypothetical protein